MKKIPERTCMACRQKKEKKQLARIVRVQDGSIIYDQTGKVSGRGAYICKKLECLDKVIKSNQLSKSLNRIIDEKVYEDLRKAFVNE